jgi:hypothetical protein
MRSTSRIPVWVSILVGATAAGLLAVAGCALDKPENQPKQIFERIGGSGKGGQILQPRQCLIRVVILDRPYGDPAVNGAAWKLADEQVIAAPQRKALEANGLRIGRVIGGLPREIETILSGQGPDHAKLEPSTLLLESGQATLISVTPQMPEASLLISRNDRVSGKDYRDITGFLRLTPRHDGAHAVSIRVTPELHHGPLRRSFPTLPTTGGPAPQQLSIRDSQKEESLDELGVDLVLEDGQYAIFGARPEKQRSLGSFLFSQAGGENEEQHQRLVILWASRNMNGVIAEGPSSKNDDRPRMFRRLVDFPDGPPPPAAAPDPKPPSIAPPPDPTSKPPADPAAKGAP